MKRQFKLIILSILLMSGLFFTISIGLVKGVILMTLAIFGVYIIEDRQVKRTLDYFEPLLFRCGRVDYVEEGLELLNETLVFRGIQSKKLLYLEYGLMNLNKRYDEVLESSVMLDQSRAKKNRLLATEINYAMLKLDKEVTVFPKAESYREELLICLDLIQKQDFEQAIEALLKLREEETGNIIFREVNEQLGELYRDKDPDAAQYYAMIAETFSNEMSE